MKKDEKKTKSGRLMVTYHDEQGNEVQVGRYVRTTLTRKEAKAQAVQAKPQIVKMTVIVRGTAPLLVSRFTGPLVCHFPNRIETGSRRRRS